MTEEEISTILSEIQQSVPKEWYGKLFREQKKTPTAEFVAKKVLKQKDLDPKKREEIELLIKTGEFSKTERVLDEKMAQKIDKFVERKIQYAIRRGLLPKKEELENLPFFKEKYAKRTP